MIAPDTSAQGGDPDPNGLSLQILSDLHLENNRQLNGMGSSKPYTFEIPVKADMLALLGDIGLSKDDQLFEWIRKQLRNFKIVFYVAGNGEGYYSSLEESTERFLRFSVDLLAEKSRASSSGDEPTLGRFIYLDKTRFDLSPTISILGCTLWSKLDPINKEIMDIAWSDFQRIQNFTPDMYDSLHISHLTWLNTTIQHIIEHEPHRSVLVFTHHAPTFMKTSDPRYEHGMLRSVFASEVSEEPCWDERVVKVWAFGHTHFNSEFVWKGVRCLSNQRGYREAEPGFDPGMSWGLS